MDLSTKEFYYTIPGDHKVKMIKGEKIDKIDTYSSLIFSNLP